MKWTITERHQGMNIRHYLQEVCHFSRRMLSSVKSGGSIMVDGQRQTVRHRLQTGEVLDVRLPPEQIGAHLHPEEMDLDIIYEDADMIVIDKPAGVPVLPSPQYRGGTIANGILAYYKNNNLPYTIHIVTRLDRGTSGLMLVAKHRYSHSILSDMQKNNEIVRKYKAIAEGEGLSGTGTIRAPIGRKPGSIIEHAVIESGKESVTHYQVIRTYGDHVLVQVLLETGRTHQIRVHFAHINHPLAGDDLYGGKQESISRHALHCYELKLKQPFTMEELIFHSDIATDMKRLLSRT